MSNLDRGSVEAFQNDSWGIENTAAVGGLPPGYIEGFRPVLLKNLTVQVGGGITSVQGQRVNAGTQILTRQMWNSPYTGGDEGFFYYVYLTREGQYKVDFTKPTFSNTEYYYAHPAFGWRVILRLWVDSDDKIKFVSREFSDTDRTVTVAPKDYIGEADYYCDGENDQIWIQAAIDFAEEIVILSGEFVLAGPVVSTKDGRIVRGNGNTTLIKANFTDSTEYLFGINVSAAVTGISGWVFRDFSYQNVGVGGSVDVVYIRSANNTVASNIDLLVGTLGQGGIKLQAANFSTIRETTFRSSGPEILDCSYVTIDNCFFDDVSFTSSSSGDSDAIKVTNCTFAGSISGLIKNAITISNSKNVLFSTNNISNYGEYDSNMEVYYSLLFDDSSGKIDGNTFYQSGVILGRSFSASEQVVVGVTNNEHRDSCFWYDDGGASFGPAVNLGLEPTLYANEWEQVLTPDITDPYTEKSPARAMKHFSSGRDVYLDENSTSADLGLSGGIAYVVTITTWHPSTSTPGNTTFKFQGYDGSSWNDIDTATASTTDEWEYLSLDVSLSNYDGYRILLDSAEEYFVYAVTTRAVGYTNYNKKYAFTLYDETVSAASSNILLGTYGQNTWDVTGSVEIDAITSNKTLRASDVGLNLVDPTDGAFTITMDSPAKTRGLNYIIRNQHYGNGLIDRGDCESTTAPAISGEVTVTTSSATFARDSGQARAGTYSYKMTKSGASCRVSLADNETTSDQHGLVDSETYTLGMWVYVPSTGGPLASEVTVVFDHYAGSWITLGTATATEQNVWEWLSVTVTLTSSTTGVRFGPRIADAAANTEFIYVDDIQLYRRYDVTINAPSGSSIGGSDTWVLAAGGDYIDITSDGENYLINDAGFGWARDFTALDMPNRFFLDMGSGIVEQGSNSNGSYIVFSSGIQVCWRDFSEIRSLTNAYGSLYQGSWTLTFPKAFASTPAVAVGKAQWLTGASWATVAQSISTTAFLMRAIDVSSRASNTVYQSYIAIGMTA